MPRDPLSNWLIARTGAKAADDGDRSTQLTLLEGHVSIVVNTLLFIIKLALGLWLASIALLADAIHTLADSATSVVIIISARIASRPADREHPFGHGRAELVGALIVAVMLGVAGLEFAKSAIVRIWSPEPMHAPWWAIALIALTAGVKQWLAMLATTIARITGSKAVEADAWHHLSDVFATLLVVVALIASRWGLLWVDGVMGCGVAAILLWAAWHIAGEAISPLLGEAPSSEELAEIERVARTVPGVRGVHDIVVHRYGRDRVVSLHVETSDQCLANELHTIAESVEERIAAEAPGMVVVHVDPIDDSHVHYNAVQVLLAEQIAAEPELASFHDLRVLGEEENFSICVDIGVHEALGEGAITAIRGRLNAAVHASFAGADLQANFQPPYAYGPGETGGGPQAKGSASSQSLKIP